jgi:hypothetical protein
MAAGVGVFIGSAFAAKECMEGVTSLPDVDAGGMIVANIDPADDTCRFCVNTNNGKTRVKCEGTVENASGENQKYKNDDFFAEPGVEKSLYKVKADGAAKLTIKGFAVE